MRSLLALTYVLPLRATGDADPDLAGYVEWLAGVVDEVIVVDASPPAVFAAHREVFGGLVVHVPPDPGVRYLMGKVDGVETGLRLARNEAVVIADDDVRYGRPELEAMAGALREAHLVRPQNYFAPLPWHARWDTGRTLLNRAVTGDYPGTLGVRASCFRAIGGYDGDVLFENLELMRSVAAAGGVLATRLDVLVERRPPTTRHFLGQRVRQAYDDLTLPARFALFLSIGPAVAAALRARRPRLVGLGAAGCVALAEAGRRRAGGARVYPVSCSLMAPLWVAERATTVWAALAQRLFLGGTKYGDRRIPRAATPPRELRRRLAGLAPPLPGEPAAAPSGSAAALRASSARRTSSAPRASSDTAPRATPSPVSASARGTGP